MKILALAVALALAAGGSGAAAEDNLCYVPGCECNPAAGDLTDVVCKCVENQVRTDRKKVGQGEGEGSAKFVPSILVCCRGQLLR